MDINIQESLGQKIKTARMERGYSQKQLGELIGIPQQAISFYEKGLRPIRVDFLVHIAEVCDVPISYFFFEIDDTEKWYSLINDLPLELRKVGFEQIQTLAKLKNDQSSVNP